MTPISFSISFFFTGTDFKDTGGLPDRLQQALVGGTPHLLILDGLGSVQAMGGTGRPRGELHDRLLKRLVCWLAAGLGTRAKALITSRFPLPDLEGYVDRGFRQHHLTDLEPVVALAVLRAWGVRGSDADLQKVLEPLQDEANQSVHALTISVLGSYLGKLWGGDPTKVPTFDVNIAATSDPKAANLNRILVDYSEKLSSAERDLVSRLSIFLHGVTVEMLGHLIDAGGEVAGRMIGCNEASLRRLLEGLHDLGLVFQHETTQGLAFTAHPFVRKFFRDLHGIPDPKKIHEVVRRKLAAGLVERPDKKSWVPAELDRYERLIEATRLAGDTNKAFDLFLNGLGGYQHLGRGVGDNARGLRVLSSFSTDGTPHTAGFELPVPCRAELLVHWGRFAEDVGDLAAASPAFEIHNRICRKGPAGAPCSSGWLQLALVEALAGHWPATMRAATNALSHSATDENRRDAIALFGAACLSVGDIARGRSQLSIAAQITLTQPVIMESGIWESEMRLRIGDSEGAQKHANQQYSFCFVGSKPDDVAGYLTFWGRRALPGDPLKARQQLTEARKYVSRSGNVEGSLRCYHLAAEIARHERDLRLAVTEAINGIQLADSCGFGHWSIVIRLEFGQVQVAAGEFQEAIGPVAKAIEMSEHLECQYAWGIADGLHLLGVIRAHLGNKPEARVLLQRAVEKRRLLEHPGLKESEEELYRVAKPEDGHGERDSGQ